LIWVAGFIFLFAIDLFLEFFVFEWLQWNETEKNDWFFVLWWSLVGAWFALGAVFVLRRTMSP